MPRIKRMLAYLVSCIWNDAQADRDRWVLWLPVAFGIGISLYFALPAEPASVLGWALGTSGVLLGAAALGSDTAALRVVLSCCAAALIGFSVAKHRADSVAAPILLHKTGPTVVEGLVESTELHGKGVRVVLFPRHVRHLPPNLTPRRARISIRSGGEALRPRDQIQIRAVLMPPPRPAAPNDYDFGRAAYFRQIGAVGFAYGRPQILRSRHSPGFSDRIGIAIESLRARLSKRIHAVLPGSTGAIASALITGDRGGISEEDEFALRDAGLAHVLAIAGLHMALVGLGLFWAARAMLALFPAIALTQPIKKWAAVAALASATFYLVISGAATPATRAYIMLTAMLTAVLFDRPAISMRSVALAASIILVLRPEAIIEPGFQMSFAAVVGLVAVAEWERSRRHSTSPRSFAKLRHYFRGIATTSLVGSIATAPYAAFHFDRATHYAVLGNLCAMPIMGFVTMPAAALSLFLMPFGLDRYPLVAMGWGIEAMVAVGRWVSGLPGSISLVSAWPVSAVIYLSLGGLWIALWRRPWRWLGLVPVAAAAAIIFVTKPPDLIVARDGLTIALRTHDGQLKFARSAADKYSAEEWLKRDGDDRNYASAIATPRDGVSCDFYGCIAESAGIKIAAVAKPAALDEDCVYADVVVSAVPTRQRCLGPSLVIDRFDVARNGAYAVWLQDGIRFQTAQEVRGVRPWSMTTKRRQYRRISPTSFP